MTTVPRFTTGRFTALWVVLRSAAKLGAIADPEELLSFARRDGLRCGGLPIKDGFQLAILGGFLRGEDQVALTDLGVTALSRCTEDEPSSEVLRLFISVLLLRHPPAWVAYWQGDPSSLDIVLPETSRELLNEAKFLATPAGTEDLEAWALWDALRATPPLELLAEQRKAIGDAAETLSFNYEKERLIREGYATLAARVRWLARESPAYGFDILSFFGSLGETAPDRPLAVEVKGQAVTGLKQFTFFLTSHEWETASALGVQYLLHLWDGVRPGTAPSAGRAEPLLIQSDSLKKHIPSRPRCGDACDWSATLITLDVHAVAGHSANCDSD